MMGKEKRKGPSRAELAEAYGGDDAVDREIAIGKARLYEIVRINDERVKRFFNQMDWEFGAEGGGLAKSLANYFGDPEAARDYVPALAAYEKGIRDARRAYDDAVRGVCVSVQYAYDRKRD